MHRSEPIHVSVGKIVLNLEALEFLLRLFLYESVGPKDPVFRFEKLSVGDSVPETPLTSYDPLGDLMRKVNARLEQLGSPYRVDEALLAVRDAFAHGRAVGLDPQGPYRLVKFSPPKSGFVRVEAATELSPAWLHEQARRTTEQIVALRKAGRSLGLTCFPEDERSLLPNEPHN